MTSFYRSPASSTGVDSTEFMSRVRLATALAHHVPGGSVVISDLEGRNWITDTAPGCSVAALREAVGLSIDQHSQEPLARLLQVEDPFVDAWFVPISPVLVDMGRGVIRLRRDRSSTWAFTTLFTPEEACDLFHRVAETVCAGVDLPTELVTARHWRPQLLPDEVLEATVCLFELPPDAPAGVSPMYGELVRALHSEAVRLAHFDDELDDFLIDY